MTAHPALSKLNTHTLCDQPAEVAINPHAGLLAHWVTPVRWLTLILFFSMNLLFLHPLTPGPSSPPLPLWATHVYTSAVNHSTKHPDTVKRIGRWGESTQTESRWHTDMHKKLYNLFWAEDSLVLKTRTEELVMIQFVGFKKCHVERIMTQNCGATVTKVLHRDWRAYYQVMCICKTAKEFPPAASRIHPSQLSLHKWYVGASAESGSLTKKWWMMILLLIDSTAINSHPETSSASKTGPSLIVHCI